MGENSQPLTTEADLRRANRGIITIMLGTVVVIAVIAVLIDGARSSVAAGIGGILAWLNYRWLDASTRSILVDPIVATTPILAMKYLFRYVVIAGVLLAIWYYDVLPVAWIIAGLASFAAAVVIRGLKSIFTGTL